MGGELEGLPKFEFDLASPKNYYFWISRIVTILTLT